MSEQDKRRRTFWPGKEGNNGQPQGVLQKRTYSELSDDTQASKPISLHVSRPALPVRVAKLDKSPWQDYVRLLSVNRGGRVTVAYNSNKSHKLVAISEISECSREQLRDLRPLLHENIVVFTAAYFLDRSIYLIYDLLPVNLISVLNTPLGPLQVEDIATVCQGILRGIQFIHQELGIEYGELKSENVLFNRGGLVKIANVGSLVLKDRRRSLERDIQAAGLLLLKMLEPDSSLLYPQSLQLRRPSSCDPDARDLMENFPTAEIKEILAHNFFLKSRGIQHLIPYVFVAEILQQEAVDIVHDIDNSI
ncbi:serine/threonine protein kinase [Cladophialophora psammophila CBS 110553]|uniref:Serine/threonine protein kinase n=1 Tax=Cladophialophora psammophila CBS 110553 TaxID=1182543 RepID=W9X610_9EURO|nr:serine/threonine protein kinase [Cladophialophora psammophila CBS 110553]EXJ72780.1 serine/threonine protein kinase [Cladophialophora psammophila CBS 110553]